MSQENPSKNISPEHLLESYVQVLKQVLSVQSIFERLWGATVWTDFSCPMSVGFNQSVDWRPSAGD